ncbi:hypothetical protein [Streptomyces sp. NPDC054887]
MPDQPTDPLRERYAAAIVRGGGCIDLAAATDAVLAVRDRRIEELTAEGERMRGQIARVRDALTERRTQVAEYEAENEPSSWSDAVTVTCARVEDALRVFPEPGAVRVDDDGQPQDRP